MRREAERPQDILDAISAIEKAISKGRKELDEDEYLWIYVSHHLQVIGEAATFISASHRQRHANIPWRSIVGMRNAIVHTYFMMDKNEVWRTATHDLGPLKSAVSEILTNLESDN